MCYALRKVTVREKDQYFKGSLVAHYGKDLFFTIDWEEGNEVFRALPTEISDYTRVREHEVFEKGVDLDEPAYMGSFEEGD